MPDTIDDDITKFEEQYAEDKELFDKIMAMKKLREEITEIISEKA